MAAEDTIRTSHDGASPSDQLDPTTCGFYLRALDILDKNGVPYCVAGAYALAAYAGIVRHTKDLDVFLRRDDLPRAAEAFGRAGFRIEHTHPHWLAKAYPADGDPAAAAGAFLDLIFRAASGIWDVDAEWLRHAVPGQVVGRTAPLCPAEELIWSKAMVMERERFDGADIAHVLRRRGPTLDWGRLLRRAAGHEGVLLGHLVFFQYVYPCDADHVPPAVLDELSHRAAAGRRGLPPGLCRGTLLSWDQYLPDVREGGMIDARLRPWGNLTPEEVDRWTEAEK